MEIEGAETLGMENLEIGDAKNKTEMNCVSTARKVKKGVQKCRRVGVGEPQEGQNEDDYKFT